MVPSPLPGAALVAIQALALPATAIATGLDGEWCNAEADGILFWEEHALGFGEHTMCDWQEPPAGRDALSTMIHCASIYLNGDEVVKMNPQSHRFNARLLADDRLEIQFNDDAPVTMTRCDH